MTTLKVPDMHCEKCVARITKALTEAEDCLRRIRLERAAREVKRLTQALKGAEGSAKTALLKQIQELTKAK